MQRKMQVQQNLLVTESPPEIVDVLRSDARITSIVSRPKSAASQSERPSAFQVFDLISNHSYLVEPWKGFHQVTFQTSNRELVVTVQPDADLKEIAELLDHHLESILKSI